MSLLENLIIFSIVSAALFGAINAQTLALRRLQLVFYQDIALEQAQGLMERFRTSQSAEQLSQEAIQFEEQLKNLLPQGRSEFHCAYRRHECTINIFWQSHGDQSVNLSSLI
jgi:Tfp pilus assembly protein PilV